MKKLLFAWLVLSLLSGFCIMSGAEDMEYDDDIMYAENEDGEVRPLDLGEPTEEEKAEMNRDAHWKNMEDRGFQGGIEDTDQEMAGDDSDSNWIFN